MNNILSKIALSICFLPLLSFAETYKVAINPNSPPKAFQDEHGLATGIDIDLMRAIAKSQGFEVEFFAVDKKLATIDSGQYDIAPSIVITDKRKEQYGVSQPYSVGYTTALYTKPDVLQDNSIENLKNLRVAVVFNTNKYNLLKEMEIPLVEAKTTFLGIKMVFQNNADVFVSDDSILKYSMVQNPALKANLMDLSVNGVLEQSDYGFVVKKENRALLDKINAGLADIKANGEYDAILKKWLGEDK